MKSTFCILLGFIVQEWKCKRKKQKSDMPNGEKDKKGLYNEREKVMAQGTTYGSMKRPLHRLLEKLSNVQINGVECKSHAQVKVSIYTCFLNLVFSLCDIVLVT